MGVVGRTAGANRLPVSWECESNDPLLKVVSRGKMYGGKVNVLWRSFGTLPRPLASAFALVKRWHSVGKRAVDYSVTNIAETLSISPQMLLLSESKPTGTNARVAVRRTSQDPYAVGVKIKPDAGLIPHRTPSIGLTAVRQGDKRFAA